MSETLTTLRALRAAGMLGDIDLQFAGLVHRGTGSDDPALLYAAALVSHVVGQGHSCLDLASYAGQPFPGESSRVDHADVEDRGYSVSCVEGLTANTPGTPRGCEG